MKSFMLQEELSLWTLGVARSTNDCCKSLFLKLAIENSSRDSAKTRLFWSL